MKTSVAKEPRLMCRLVQGWVSVFGDGAAVPQRGVGARHVAACECCRQYFNECTVLESSLRRGAKDENETVDPDLERRIVAAVHGSARRPQRRRSPLAAISLAGAAACAALAVVLASRTPVPQDESSMAPRRVATARNSTAGNLWGELRPTADAILDAQPLQREADAVYSDARSAIGFLALNFLPSVPASLATGSEAALPAGQVRGG